MTRRITTFFFAIAITLATILSVTSCSFTIKTDETKYSYDKTEANATSNGKPVSVPEESLSTYEKTFKNSYITLSSQEIKWTIENEGHTTTDNIKYERDGNKLTVGENHLKKAREQGLQSTPSDMTLKNFEFYFIEEDDVICVVYDITMNYVGVEYRTVVKIIYRKQ